MVNNAIGVIIVATDFSAASNNAFNFSIRLAKQLGAEVIAVFVKNTDDLAIAMRQSIRILRNDKQLKEKVNRFIDHKLQMLLRNLKNDHAVRFAIGEGQPWVEILKLAKKEKADLIVTGTRSRSLISQFLLGSTAQKLVVNSFCPVITLNAKQKKPRRSG